MSYEVWAIANEQVIRVALFFGVFALVALWEVARPRRALSLPRRQRWSVNLGLVLLNTLLVRWVFPTAAVGIAALGLERNWGVLNYFEVPFWVAVPLTVIAMDFVIWLQHVMVHAVPTLWRLHRVHHADLDYDLSTGVRFHPLEIVLSMSIKFATIALMGAPILAVIIFETLLSACALFNHGNIRLPDPLDRLLRWVLVTPDMHRVHHSIEEDESNTNFGFNLTWWDKLFGTYREQARAGQLGLVFGIRAITDPRDVATFKGVLTMPFKNRTSN